MSEIQQGATAVTIRRKDPYPAEEEVTVSQDLMYGPFSAPSSVASTPRQHIAREHILHVQRENQLASKSVPSFAFNSRIRRAKTSSSFTSSSSIHAQTAPLGRVDNAQTNRSPHIPGIKNVLSVSIQDLRTPSVRAHTPSSLSSCASAGQAETSTRGRQHNATIKSHVSSLTIEDAAPVHSHTALFAHIRDQAMIASVPARALPRVNLYERQLKVNRTTTQGQPSKHHMSGTTTGRTRPPSSRHRSSG